MFLFLTSSFISIAQVRNNGILYVGNQGGFYVETGEFTFDTSTGSTSTSRRTDVTNPLDANYGKLIMKSGTSFLDASASHFLDGYASHLGSSAFTFPIGNAGIYAPIKVVPESSSGVDAGYYNDNPTSISAALDAIIESISTVEYWDIIGTTNAQLTLTWRSSSNISSLVTYLNELTIVGFDGTKWVEIPSSYDATSILGSASNMTSGSITSLLSQPVDLSLYKAFTLGSKGISCSPLISSSGMVKTYFDGEWSPSSPTLADPVIINSPYNAGSFVCNSLVLNQNITLTDGQSVEVVNGVTGSAKIIMSSESSFVQRASGVTAPNIELTKKTRDQMRQFDYIYWGTPISGNFFSQINGAQASTSPIANAFDLKYKYVSGSGGGWQVLTQTESGKGFITRVKSQAPFTSALATDYINMKFTGVANNGDISVPITNNPNSLNGGTSHVLLANPYPSAIDADKFLAENTNIDGVVYIWSAATANGGGAGQNYTQADYIAYTKAGVVVPSNVTTTFNGKIASGQGFKVKSLSNSGNVTFTNCMRSVDNNDQFYRSNNYVQTQPPRDRFKLNLTGENGVFNQILVAYLPEATLGYDRLLDAGKNSVSTAQLYSILEVDGRRLSINARPAFETTDEVSLGISKSSTTAQNFTIGIAEREGIFDTTDVMVYLYDSLLDLYHNLGSGSYTFTTNTTALNNRFKIVYQAPLSNQNFQLNNVVAKITDEMLNIESRSAISNVSIYDISGRLIMELNVNNELVVNNDFVFAEGIYVAKIQLESGVVFSQKLVNKK